MRDAPHGEPPAGRRDAEDSFRTVEHVFLAFLRPHLHIQARIVLDGIIAAGQPHGLVPNAHGEGPRLDTLRCETVEPFVRGLRIGPLAAQHVPNALDGLPVRGGKDTVPARPAGRHLRHGRRVQLKERGRRIIAQQQRHHVIGEPPLPVPVNVTGTQTLPVAGIAHVQSHADDHFRRPPRIARLPDGLWHRHHVPLFVPDVQGLAAVFLFPGLGALQQTHQMRHDSPLRAVQAGMVTVSCRTQSAIDITLHDTLCAALSARDKLEPVCLAGLPFQGVNGREALVQIVPHGIPLPGVVCRQARHGRRSSIRHSLDASRKAVLVCLALLTARMHEEVQQVLHLLNFQRDELLPVQTNATLDGHRIRIFQIQKPAREHGHQVND